MARFDQIRELMTEMYDLLHKHDEGQQRIPLSVIEAIDREDGSDTERLLKWGGFWGGAGTVDDLILQEIPWTSKLRVDKPDDDRLHVLLAELKREMQALNILRPWPESLGSGSRL